MHGEAITQAGLAGYPPVAWRGGPEWAPSGVLAVGATRRAVVPTNSDVKGRYLSPL